MNGGNPARFGLYDARYEHDSCGTGFVVDVAGRRSHGIVRDAVAALGNLAHRGAVSADGLSGDGAGVLTQIPYELFERVLCGQGVAPPPREEMSPDRDENVQRRVIAETIERSGMSVIAWREVPLGDEALGPIARESCPRIRQVIVRRPHDVDDETFERRLYLARKRIESTFRAANLGPLHIPSFSARKLVYKGLMAAPQLAAFYPDLADSSYTSAIGLFHQRYSTNTFPKWHLAQPFRYLAHNGEINTLRSNVASFRAALGDLVSDVWGDDLLDLLPVLEEDFSDSLALDNVLELLTMSGRDLLHSMMMLVPMAYQQRGDLPPEIEAFYEYHATLMSPWDGPAALAFSDGRIAAATLDRNGLRPLRYWITTDGVVVVGSETGIVPIPPERRAESGRLGPGQVLAVDTQQGRILHDEEIKFSYARRKPYATWIAQRMLKTQPTAHAEAVRRSAADLTDFVRMEKAFAYGAEDIERVLAPMVLDGKEPVGSMGDDTPHAFLSAKPKTIYRYFKQLFAQVTNPPLDHLRERLVMSRRIALGGRSCVLDESPDAAALVKFASPVIGTAQFEWIMGSAHPRFGTATLNCCFPVAEGPEGLSAAVERLCTEAVARVEAGAALIILSDRRVDAEHAPVPMLLATAAVHHHLIRAGRRMRASIICDTGDVRLDHHFACLLGYGAALIHPYVALAAVARMVTEDERAAGMDLDTAVGNYLHTIENGILKIMSKMGISTISSYRGSHLFEVMGLDADLVEKHFVGTTARIGGVGLIELARDVLRFHAEAYGEEPGLSDRGIYHYRKDGEYHGNNPTANKLLHKAVRQQSAEDYARYSALVDVRPACHIRDLLAWKKAPQAVPLAEVESAADIAKRFCTQAMSHGAISREAHEVLAIAMNRLGAKSNSGEGGESAERYYPYPSERPDRSLASWHPHTGDWANSGIKQVASGRFGVTPEYLISAQELEIKMSQGSKPGEGGQIPGPKVSVEIAQLRHATPGRPLISPPPHHDIYSIEDLGQLVYDLKRVNPVAKVGVKLVAVAGIGTIAAGVVKAYADCIQVSGFDGGTGASPLSSIKNAGMPWELGLAEVQQVLVLNNLRGRVTVRVDGGMKTGRDVVIAALLGADEFGFGTTALVAAGCVMVRQCHLNNCPVGIATQREDLRKKFPGEPEHVIALMLFIAEQVRLSLAEMGLRRLEDAIGRVDLLERRTDVHLPKTTRIDLAALLADADPSGEKPRHCVQARNERPESGTPLDERVWRDCESHVLRRAPLVLEYPIRNSDRSVGARLAGGIARTARSAGLPDGTIELHFEGCAGLSFGAFCNRGMMLVLEGEAQDFVGKGACGGTIVLRPPASAAHANGTPQVIMGNTVMYGATGGELFAAGRGGERLAVRNSGGRIVVEGCGDHGCEYMTNGVVVVLGETGRNFGAGMTGGVAYVLDEEGLLGARINAQSVRLEAVSDELDGELLQALIQRHGAMTGSAAASRLLVDWSAAMSAFRCVVPLIDDPTWAETQAAIKQKALEALRAFGGASARV
jgi:glutamate synthase domain-containing protein 2/glutamate synthase domain-containing protein 1/glutamate synthase domain-containing protein 3